MRNKSVKLTVKEFAELTGISRQAVYRRIKTGELARYIDEADGVTTIDRKAAILFTANTVKFTEVDSKPAVNDKELKIPAEDTDAVPQNAAVDSKVDKQVDRRVDNEFEKVLLYQAERIKELEAENKRLYELLAVRAEDQTKSTQDIAQRLADLIEQQHQLQQNTQILLAKAVDPAASSGNRQGIRKYFSRLLGGKKTAGETSYNTDYDRRD